MDKTLCRDGSFIKSLVSVLHLLRSLKTVKLFIGNVSHEATSEELQRLFEQYGNVVECEKKRNFAFVVSETRLYLFTVAIYNYNITSTKHLLRYSCIKL